MDSYDLPMMGWLMLAHVGGIVLWTAGILAAQGAFVERTRRTSEGAQVCVELERRFMFWAAHPGMTLAIVGGIGMFALNPSYYWTEYWMRGKLALAVFLVVATVAMTILHNRSRSEPVGSWERAARTWRRLFVLAAVLVFFLAFVKPI